MNSPVDNPYWQEDQPDVTIADDVVDLAFAINCRSLPVDHAWALSQAISAVLPWWDHELVGLHLIHGGDSGNGWQRPSDLLYLTRRTRLTLRLPRARIMEARALQGQVLMVAGYSLTVGEATERPLIPYSTLYARHVVMSNDTLDENAFMAQAAQQLRSLGISIKKMLAGKASALRIPDGACNTRSLLVADLHPQHALELQRRGLGLHRTWGCGLFVPHKTLANANSDASTGM